MKKLGAILPMYRRLLAYVKPYRTRLLGGIVFGVLYGPANGVVLSVVQKAWASAFESNWKYTWLQILGFAALLPVAMVGRGLFDFLGTYLMSWVGLRAVMDLRVDLFRHIQSLSLDFFSESRTGELISRVTNDVGLVQQSISNTIEDVIKQPVTVISVLGWLLYKDWKFTVAALGLFPLCLVPILIFGRRTRAAARAGQEHQASLVSVLHEAIAGLRVIKAFGAEAREVADFRGVCLNFFRQRMRVTRARASLPPIIEVIAGFGGALAFVYAYIVHMPGSKFVPMALGLFMLYEPVKKLSRVHLVIQESMSAAERIFQVLDRQSSVQEAANARTLPRFSRSIRFEDISFSYASALDGRNGAVLDRVSLEIQAGSLIAFVGASGAGKTTLFNFIPRFYDPTGGALLIDGVDVRDVTFKSLRDQIGLVTQETFLFNDTLAKNIAYGKPGATMDEIINATKRAHAHDFIVQMPQQYETMIGDLGVKLSGGQRQRIAIARAILQNPPILLLDEATSALDTESERAVQAALDELMFGSKAARHLTMLVIAHRLSTVQHADRIIVLDKGRIAEQGTHEELLALGKTYKRLHELQFRI